MGCHSQTRPLGDLPRSSESYNQIRLGVGVEDLVHRNILQAEISVICTYTYTPSQSVFIFMHQVPRISGGSLVFRFPERWSLHLRKN